MGTSSDLTGQMLNLLAQMDDRVAILQRLFGAVTLTDAKALAGIFPDNAIIQRQLELR